MGACESSQLAMRRADSSTVVVDVQAVVEGVLAKRAAGMCCAGAEQLEAYKVTLQPLETPQRDAVVDARLEAVQLSEVETQQAQMPSGVETLSVDAKMNALKEGLEPSKAETRQASKLRMFSKPHKVVEPSKVETQQTELLPGVAKGSKVPESHETPRGLCQVPVAAHSKTDFATCEFQSADAKLGKPRFAASFRAPDGIGVYPCPPCWHDHEDYVERLETVLTTFALDPDLLEMQISARRSRFPVLSGA